MPESVKSDLSKAGVKFYEHNNFDTVIAFSDVLYATRVQKERFDSMAEYEAVKDMFVINNDVLARAKESAIVMHPLPRNEEIDPEVDFDSRRAAYFRQMRYF
jgi:carbamoyl-phosphate synthase/aspartate carbamoyltransferase